MKQHSLVPWRAGPEERQGLLSMMEHPTNKANPAAPASSAMPSQTAAPLALRIHHPELTQTSCTTSCCTEQPGFGIAFDVHLPGWLLPIPGGAQKTKTKPKLNNPGKLVSSVPNDSNPKGKFSTVKQSFLAQTHTVHKFSFL